MHVLACLVVIHSVSASLQPEKVSPAVDHVETDELDHVNNLLTRIVSSTHAVKPPTTSNLKTRATAMGSAILGFTGAIISIASLGGFLFAGGSIPLYLLTTAGIGCLGFGVYGAATSKSANNAPAASSASQQEEAKLLSELSEYLTKHPMYLAVGSGNKVSLTEHGLQLTSAMLFSKEGLKYREFLLNESNARRQAKNQPKVTPLTPEQVAAVRAEVLTASQVPGSTAPATQTAAVKAAATPEGKPSKLAIWFGDTFGGILLRVGGVVFAVSLAYIYCCGGNLRCYIVAGLALVAAGVAIYLQINNGRKTEG